MKDIRYKLLIISLKISIQTVALYHLQNLLEVASIYINLLIRNDLKVLQLFYIKNLHTVTKLIPRLSKLLLLR